MAIYGLKGEWEVENHGITPDVEVNMDPALVRQGHDPQLEKAVEVVMEQLKEESAAGLQASRLPELPPKSGNVTVGRFTGQSGK